MSRELTHPFEAYVAIVRQLLQASQYNPVGLAVYDTAVKDLADTIEVKFLNGKPRLGDPFDVYHIEIILHGNNYQQVFSGPVSRLATHNYYNQLYYLFGNTKFKETYVAARSAKYGHPIAFAISDHYTLDDFIWGNGYVSNRVVVQTFEFDFSENEWASNTGRPLTEGADLAYMRNDNEIGFLRSEVVITLSDTPPDAMARLINGWNIFRDHPIETIQSIGRAAIDAESAKLFDNKE